MNRFLSLRPSVRVQVFEQAAEARGLPPASVAKDFWVCLALRELLAIPDLGTHFTFKGGTSLSKAWGLIDRFSEDIDLTISHTALGIDPSHEPINASSGGERQRRLTAIKVACQQVVQQSIAAELTARFASILGKSGWSLTMDPEDLDQQTLLFAYPESPSASEAYLRPVAKLEFGARGEPWPAEERLIRAIVAEELPHLFDAPAISVRALRPERTFWEKVMLLHEERLRPGDRPIRRAMARHYYDVWRLIDSDVAAAAAADIGLFDQVAAHRELYFRQTWMDYDTLKKGRIEMLPAEAHLDEWRRDYEAMKGEMFVTPPPSFNEILEVIQRFQTDFNAA